MFHGEEADDIVKVLKDCGALRVGEFVLKSGITSKYYVDIKKASTNPMILRIITQKMYENLQKMNLKVDRIAGIVLGSIPLAVALSLKTGIPYVMIRGEKKNHGTEELIEGTFDSGDKVLVVEDVITSAGSSIAGISVLRDKGVIVENVFSVIDREMGGAEALARVGVTFTPLVKLSEFKLT
ncbi:MAG: orotate phosphoribosyltransferase [archaeon]|nr:orotate phosphoribosyltransferase [archaeon]